MQQSDICIVGAGPAGVSMALFLAKQKIPCTLIDKSIFPRDKICGDALSGKVAWVLRKLDPAIETDIRKQSFQLPSWGIHFYGTQNNCLKVPFKQNYDTTKDKAPGFVIARKDFDHYLYQKAVASNYINRVEGVKITKTKRVADGIIIGNQKQDFQLKTKLLVVANGAYSTIAKDLLGLKIEDKSNSLGLRTYYKGVEGLNVEGYIELHFLKEFLPGYFWIFPMANGMANVGAGIRSDLMRKNKINIKKQFQQIIKTHPILSKRFKNATLVDDIKLYGLPLGSEKRTLSADNVLLLGDSAALIDPFTGEGIGNAMISGMQAAECVAKLYGKKDFSSEKLKAYDQAIYKRLSSELNLSKKLQELSRYPWLFNFVVNKASKSTDLQELMSCMFENVDIRKKLSNPLFYLKIIFS